MNSFLELNEKPIKHFKASQQKENPFIKRVISLYSDFKSNVEQETITSIDKLYGNYISKP